MLQIPALSLLRESLQNSLINHRNQRWKLGHVTHASYLHREFVTHTVLLSALSRQLLNDSSAEVFPNSPGRLLHSPVNIIIRKLFTGQPHPLRTNFASLPFCSVPIYILSNFPQICSWCYLNHYLAKIVAQETFFCLSCNTAVVCCYF